ncbi:hypothetical protein [Candidatus Uabimicrobium sp. HlEnr_7]|uniref:hypothetical protein n=1 Tax=Candidatus Uabimicrobium helgolandensis TaxID=3095367 RepID=UPI003558C0EC
MAKYVYILIAALAFVGCHQRYQFENVGTTAAVPVVNTQKKAAQTAPSKKEVEKQVALAEKKMTKVVKAKASSIDDMGTQDSDWVDVVTTETKQPQVQEPKTTRKMPYYLTPEYQNSIKSYRSK